MANLSFLDLADQLQLNAPGAPLPYLVRCMRDASIEFCKASESYIHHFPATDAVAGTNTYQIAVPAETRIHKALRVTFDGTAIKPTSPVLLDADMPSWDSEQHTPSRYFMENQALILAPVPPESLTGAINGTFALSPTRTATGIDEDFYEDNEQALLDGARVRLFQDSKNPWGDPMLANIHLALFSQAIEDAKAKAQHDHTAKPRTMCYAGL